MLNFNSRDLDDSDYTGGRRETSFKRWLTSENYLYAKFLEKQLEEEKSVSVKKRRGFYQEMSKAIKTKSNLQCRTHHVKMLMTHLEETRIVEFFLRQRTETETFEFPTAKNDEEKMVVVALEPSEFNKTGIVDSLTYSLIEVAEGQFGEFQEAESFFDIFMPPDFP